MNDAGLEEPISTAGQQVENKYSPSGDYQPKEDEEEKNYLSPSRWWFANTAFPLIAVCPSST